MVINLAALRSYFSTYNCLSVKRLTLVILGIKELMQTVEAIMMAVTLLLQIFLYRYINEETAILS